MDMTKRNQVSYPAIAIAFNLEAGMERPSNEELNFWQDICAIVSLRLVLQYVGVHNSQYFYHYPKFATACDASRLKLVPKGLDRPPQPRADIYTLLECSGSKRITVAYRCPATRSSKVPDRGPQKIREWTRPRCR
jgi:hypothetical protein